MLLGQSQSKVDKLHAAGILVMNMIGAPKHVPKAIEAGVDLICAQGGEGMLIPTDACIVGLTCRRWSYWRNRDEYSDSESRGHVPRQDLCFHCMLHSAAVSCRHFLIPRANLFT
jgi:hypothetical protein